MKRRWLKLMVNSLYLWLFTDFSQFHCEAKKQNYHWQKRKLNFSHIRMGSVAKPYMRKGGLPILYEEMRKYITLYEEAVSHDFATDHFWIPLHIRKIWFSFFQCNTHSMQERVDLAKPALSQRLYVYPKIPGGGNVWIWAKWLEASLADLLFINFTDYPPVLG